MSYHISIIYDASKGKDTVLIAVIAYTTAQYAQYSTTAQNKHTIHVLRKPDIRTTANQLLKYARAHSCVMNSQYSRKRLRKNQFRLINSRKLLREEAT